MANLTDASKLPQLMETADDKLGGIDILVADFPLVVEAPLSDSDPQLDKLLELRAGLVAAICDAAMPRLKKSPAGRIINIGFLRSLFAADAQDGFERAEQDLAATDPDA